MAFQATLSTMLIFFLMLAIGFIAGRTGVIKPDFMPGFSQLITKVFLPALIFYSTVTSVTAEKLADNLVILALSAGVYIVLALFALIVAKAMRLPHDKDRVFQFAFIFGNTGFVGIPLLSAVFPDYGLLFMCLFTVVDQLLFWTYGVWLSTARDRQSKKFNLKALITPNMIAIILALAFVVASIPLPPVIGDGLGMLSKATSPLCMIYLGATVCFSPFASALKRPETYAEILVKMVALPIACGLLLMQTPLPYEMTACLTLTLALPVMTVVPMIAGANGHEGPYATGIAVATFLACVVTIPLVAFVVL